MSNWTSQESVLDQIKAEIKEKSYLTYDNNPRRVLDEECVLEILKRNIGAEE